MSSNTNCLDNIPFDFHEIIKKILKTNLPSKCGDIQNLLEIFPLNYGHEIEEDFLQKIKDDTAKNEVKALDEKNLLHEIEKKFIEKQINFLEEKQKLNHQPPQQSQQISFPNETPKYPYLQRTAPEIENSSQATSININSPTASCIDETSQQHSFLNTNLSSQNFNTQSAHLETQFSQLNSKSSISSNQILQPTAPSHTSTSYSQNPSVNINLKDFEAETDLFDNLSLEIINEKEELDKVFFGQKTQNSDEKQHEKNLSPTSIRYNYSNYNPVTYNQVSTKDTVNKPAHTTLYNPILTYTTSSDNPPPTYPANSSAFNPQLTNPNNTLSYPSLPFISSAYLSNNYSHLNNNDYQSITTKPNNPYNKNANNVNNFNSSINSAFFYTNTSFDDYNPPNYLSNFDKSLLNNHYMKKNVYNKNSNQNFYNQNDSKPLNISKSSSLLQSTLKQSKSVSDLVKEGMNHTTHDWNQIGNFNRDEYKLVKKSFIPQSSSSSSSPSKSISFFEGEALPHTTSTGIFNKMLKLGFRNDMVWRALDIYGDNDAAVYKYLLSVTEMEKKGYKEDIVKQVLMYESDMSLTQLAVYMEKFQLYYSMGFEGTNIHSALSVKPDDQESVLDRLTK